MFISLFEEHEKQHVMSLQVMKMLQNDPTVRKEEHQMSLL